MKHPNQSFIDNFNRSTKSDDGTPTYLYSSQYTEKKRKEKFQYFVESLNNPKTSKNDSLTKVIAKIFDYNTLSKNTNKLILESKQSLGSLPQQFTYNGLLYSFNLELNMFVNQHGHAISIEQATAFMEMAQLEEIIDVSHDASLDGAPNEQKEQGPQTVPSPPINFQANLSNTLLDGVCFSWVDTSNNELGFVIYSN